MAASVGSKIIGNLTNPMITDHDYYPIQVEIASLLANKWSVPVLLAAFAGICGTVLLIASALVQRTSPNLRTIEKATIMWFVLCKLPRIRCVERNGFAKLRSQVSKEATPQSGSHS